MDIGEIVREAERVAGVLVCVWLDQSSSWLGVTKDGGPHHILWNASDPPTHRDIARLCHEIGHVVSRPRYPAHLVEARENTRTAGVPWQVWVDEVLAWGQGWPFAEKFGVPRREYLAERAACLRTYRCRMAA